MLRMNQPANWHDCDNFGACSRQANGRALGAGTRGVGIVDDEHSPAHDRSDHAEAPVAGVKMSDGLVASGEQRRQAQAGLPSERGGDQADERVLSAPRGARFGARRHWDSECGTPVRIERVEEAAEVEAQELAEEPGQQGVPLEACTARRRRLVTDEELVEDRSVSEQRDRDRPRELDTELPANHVAAPADPVSPSRGAPTDVTDAEVSFWPYIGPGNRDRDGGANDCGIRHAIEARSWVRAAESPSAGTVPNASLTACLSYTSAVRWQDLS